MPPFQRTCIVCGGPIGSRWLCLKCERAYSLDVPFRDWPGWAKMLVRLCWRERRAELRRLRYEADVPIAMVVVRVDIHGEREGG